MTPSSTVPERFSWLLSQERIYMLASALMKLETLLDTASPGTAAAENTARLLTDLRAQCVAAGAHDPYPHRPMFPAFNDTAMPAWSAEMERAI